MTVYRFRRAYIDGPLDGQIEELERPGLEPDVAIRDPATGRHQHYALAELPELSGDEPFGVQYRWVSEFDPDSDYIERVAEDRARQFPDTEA